MQASEVSVGRKHGLVSRVFHLPVLRWIDRRVRRAVDRSEPAAVVVRMEAELRAVSNQIGAFERAVTESSSCVVRIEAEVRALRAQIEADVRSLRAQIGVLEQDMKLREDAMQLRFADLAQDHRMNSADPIGTARDPGMRGAGALPSAEESPRS